jgi:hypothetical protein
MLIGILTYLMKIGIFTMGPHPQNTGNQVSWHNKALQTVKN